jgi:hypothetical protein
MYLAIIGNEVKAYRSLKQLERDNVRPDMEITAEEWDAAGRAARIISGEIVLGRGAEAEEAERVMLARDAIDRELAEINAKQARSSAEISEAVIRGVQPSEETAAFHLERQTRLETLRGERKRLGG